MGVLVIFVLLSFASSVAQAATYFVDKDSLGGSCASGNPGTQTQPVCTLTDGINKLSSGDTLYVRAATFVDEGFDAAFQGIPNGTAAARTVIAAYQQELVTMRRGWVSFYGTPLVAYVTIARFHFTEGGSFYCGSPAGCHHNRLEDCEFSMEGFVPNLTVNSSANIISGQGDNNEFLRNKIHHAPITLYDDGVAPPKTTGNYGVYYTGLNNVFDGNEIYMNTGYGIHLWSSYAGSVYNNNIIRNNTIWGNGYDDGQRAQGAAAIVMNHGHNDQVYNNVIYGNSAGIMVAGECIDCLVYNNTVYDNRLVSPSGPMNAGCIFNYGPGTIARNNICYNNMAQELQNYPPGTFATLTNNLCTAAQAGCSVVGNPVFVNAGAHDFHLQATSPARDAGAAVTLVTSDIAGTPRPQPTGGSWDIGAYEYSVTSTCPPNCPPTCPPTCPPDETPTISDLYLSPSGSDSNGCRTAETLATPKATLASGCTCMTIPGKRMLLRAGTYATLDTGSCPITGGTSWALPTKIMRYASEVPVLQLPATSPPDAVLAFRAPMTDAFIEVEGLTLDGANRTIGDGLLVVGSGNLRFKNLTIKNNQYQNVALIDATNIELTTSTLHDALSYANVVLYGTSNNILVQGNTITNGSQAGVSLDLGATSNAVTITKNTIACTVNGIDVGPGTGAVVQNNVIDSQSGTGIHFRDGAVGWKAYHNTVVSSGVGLLCDAGATGGDWANNIAVANTTQRINTCAACDGGNLLTGTLAEIFTTVPVLKESVPVSPAINSGVDIASVTDDQLGNMRPFALKWDAGAREAQTAPAPGPTTGVSVRVLMFF